MSGRRLDLSRVWRGLAALDALLEAHPELREPDAQARLTAWLEEEVPVVERHKGKPIFVRLPDELVTELDQYAAELADERPGMKASRADAIRVLLHKGLATVKREARGTGHQARPTMGREEPA
jgi:hypothetical protein